MISVFLRIAIDLSSLELRFVSREEGCQAASLTGIGRQTSFFLGDFIGGRDIPINK